MKTKNSSDGKSLKLLFRYRELPNCHFSEEEVRNMAIRKIEVEKSIPVNRRALNRDISKLKMTAPLKRTCLDLLSCKRIYEINQGVIGGLCEKPYRRVSWSPIRSARIGNFRSFRWTWSFDCEYDYMQANMKYKVLESQSELILLKVYSGELLGDDVEKGKFAVHAYFSHLDGVNMPKIESFDFVENDEISFYSLDSDTVERLRALPDSKKGREIARLVTLLATSLTEFFNSIGVEEEPFYKSKMLPIVEATEILQRKYIDARKVTERLLKNGFSAQQIVDEYDKDFWLYHYIEAKYFKGERCFPGYGANVEH